MNHQNQTSSPLLNDNTNTSKYESSTSVDDEKGTNAVCLNDEKSASDGNSVESNVDFGLTMNTIHCNNNSNNNNNNKNNNNNNGDDNNNNGDDNDAKLRKEKSEKQNEILISREEYMKSLENNVQAIEKVLKNASHNKQVSGRVVFDLHTKHKYSLDLILSIADSLGFKVDIDEFEDYMKKEELEINNEQGQFKTTDSLNHTSETTIDSNKTSVGDKNLAIPNEMNNAPTYLKYMQEDVTKPYWKLHSKHFFILSDAGKPIFSRYGNENDLNTMMGFFLAIVSFVSDSNDVIRTVIAGNIKMVFLVKGSLYLVIVARTNEPARELALQLEYLYSMIIFMLTERIQEILQKKKSFDLRYLLGGTDNLLHSLIHATSSGISFSIRSMRCLRLPKNIRNQIGDMLVKTKVPKLALSMKSSETWTPICLPSISSKAYFYAYIDYVVLDTYLVMICGSQDQFFECSKAKKNLENALTIPDFLENFLAAVKSPGFTCSDLRTTLYDLRHFIYKQNHSSQFCSAQFTPPYTLPGEKKRLYRVYKCVRDTLLLNSRSNNKIYFHVTNKESVLGWISDKCELYACFSLSTPKSAAISAVEIIKKWIKKEEDSLFFSHRTL